MVASLLQRVAAGEMAAMQDCMDEYGGMIWSLARRYSIAPAEAEDAVQEVFIALWESAGRFDPDKGAEVTFVATIARRRLIDRGRSHARRERVIGEVRDAEPRAPARETDRTSIDDEAYRAREALEQLSADQQRVLRLAVHQGYTHEQISRITDMPLGTVKTHARRGLMRVRELLNACRTDASMGSKR